MRGALLERSTTAHSSGRMLPREMRTDVMPAASCASSPADESVEAAPVPTLPTQDVLPKALPIIFPFPVNELETGLFSAVDSARSCRADERVLTLPAKP